MSLKATVTVSGKPICTFFASVKGCKNGTECRFAHTTPVSAPISAPISAPVSGPKELLSAGNIGTKKAACRFFGTPHGCSKGSACPYEHIVPNPIDSTVPVLLHEDDEYDSDEEQLQEIDDLLEDDELEEELEEELPFDDDETDFFETIELRNKYLAGNEPLWFPQCTGCNECSGFIANCSLLKVHSDIVEQEAMRYRVSKVFA